MFKMGLVMDVPYLQLKRQPPPTRADSLLLLVSRALPVSQGVTDPHADFSSRPRRCPFGQFERFGERSGGHHPPKGGVREGQDARSSRFFIPY